MIETIRNFFRPTGRDATPLLAEYRRALRHEMLVTERLRVKAVIGTVTVATLTLSIAYLPVPAAFARVLNGKFDLPSLYVMTSLLVLFECYALNRVNQRIATGGDIRISRRYLSACRSISARSLRLRGSACRISRGPARRRLCRTGRGARSPFRHRQQIPRDGFLALFGAPIADPQAAQRAVAAAREMLVAMDQNNIHSDWPLRLGIGVHLGTVVAGNGGSPRRKEYTVMGDTVNFAARLESLNKDYGSQLLISATIRDALGEACTDAVMLGEVPIRGYDTPQAIWQLA